MGLFGASNAEVRHQKDRISSMVALQLATMSMRELNKKVKFESIPFLNATIFNDMVPVDEDGNKDYKAKVSIAVLLNKIDP